MTISVVLDAAAFDVIDTAEGAQLRQLLRAVEVALARDRGGQRILVAPTDEALAKLVGAVLHALGRSSEAMADAHVVAVCARTDAAIVITSDPDDINELATALPGTRVTTRTPRARASR